MHETHLIEVGFFAFWVWFVGEGDEGFVIPYGLTAGSGYQPAFNVGDGDVWLLGFRDEFWSATSPLHCRRGRSA